MNYFDTQKGNSKSKTAIYQDWPQVYGGQTEHTLVRGLRGEKERRSKGTNKGVLLDQA